MNVNKPTFFIGYDSKEDIAYRVCKQSLLKRSSIEINVIALKLYELITKKIYKRNVDPLASTEFTYSRFLVPSLMNYNGWAVFCDCDFLFFQDVAKLFKAACTPEFYLFNNGKKLIYRGRLDSSSPGNNLPINGKDLRDAINSYISGEMISDEQFPSMGCNIKWK